MENRDDVKTVLDSESTKTVVDSQLTKGSSHSDIYDIDEFN